MHDYMKPALELVKLVKFHESVAVCLHFQLTYQERWSAFDNVGSIQVDK